MTNPYAHYPVYISLGPKDLDMEVVNKAMRLKEQELGRYLTEREVLQLMGECLEPDPSKRVFLSSSRPTSPGKLWRPQHKE